jgi:hypothetical protein
MSHYVINVEIPTDDYWMGKRIWRKVFFFPKGPTAGIAGEIEIYHGILDIKQVTALRGILQVARPNGVLDFRPIPYVVANKDYAGNGIEPILFDDHLSLFSNTGNWATSSGYVILEYTKTS